MFPEDPNRAGSALEDPAKPGKTRRSSRRAARRARARSRTKVQRWRRRVLGTLAGIIVAIPAVAGAGWWYVNYKLDQAHRVKIAKGLLVQPAKKPGSPFNILLIGSDSRQFVSSSGQASAFGSASQVGGQRSDVIIIARVVPATKQIYLLSIPRDLYVDIPGHIPYISGENRINAAFNNGPDLLIETLKKDLGIPVEHFAEVNFAGFQQMVAAVGGIHIDFPTRVYDDYSGLHVHHPGCQLLSGAEALAYVRSRHLYYYENGQWLYDGMSDWSRIRRQDIFFHALLDEVKAQVTNPLAMRDLLDAVVKNLTIDSTMTNSMLLNLAFEFRHASASSIHNEVLPTVGDVLPNGADVLLGAQPYDREMIKKFLAIGTSASSRAVTPVKSGPPTTSVGSSTTAPSTTPTTTQPSSDVVFDTQPEPWNGTPC